MESQNQADEGTEEDVEKIHVAEMRMLRWMCGHTRTHKIRYEVIREKVRWPLWWTR